MALSIVCLPVNTVEEKLQRLDELFSNADVVLLLGKPKVTDSFATKHKVLKVWKGVTGEYVYVKGGVKSGVLFAKRYEKNGALVSGNSYCHHNKLSNIDLIKQNYGNGDLPNIEYREQQYGWSYLSWPLMFSFVFLIILCMLTQAFVNHKQKG
ncbi:hypothetical protein ACM9HF_02525 [Colwellia sp. RE-S-Sl-9]